MAEHVAPYNDRPPAVYVLISKGRITYAGKTTRRPELRAGEHWESGKDFDEMIVQHVPGGEDDLAVAESTLIRLVGTAERSRYISVNGKLVRTGSQRSERDISVQSKSQAKAAVRALLRRVDERFGLPADVWERAPGLTLYPERQAEPPKTAPEPKPTHRPTVPLPYNPDTDKSAPDPRPASKHDWPGRNPDPVPLPEQDPEPEQGPCPTDADYKAAYAVLGAIGLMILGMWIAG